MLGKLFDFGPLFLFALILILKERYYPKLNKLFFAIIISLPGILWGFLFGYSMSYWEGGSFNYNNLKDIVPWMLFIGLISAVVGLIIDFIWDKKQTKNKPNL